MTAAEMAAWAQVAFAGILVGVTIYYAVQNRKMAQEMADARKLSVRPYLAIDLGFLDPTFAYVTIQNVGTGAALEVDLVITFEPFPSGNDIQPHVVRWKGNVVAAGGAHWISTPPSRLEDAGDGAKMRVDELIATYKNVHLGGTMRDALGHRHSVDERLDRMHETWEVLKQSRERFAGRMTPMERLVGAVRDVDTTLTRGLKANKSMREVFANHPPDFAPDD